MAKQEVFSRDVVAENSDVHVDNFNAIADRKSIAYKFAVEKGPYDIVNLDLCTSFSGTQDEDSCYKAAWNLFEFQLNERTEPWVFLLTTRADYKKVNPHDLPRYWQLVSDNAQKSTDFHEGLSSAYVDVSCDIIENPVAHLAKLRSPKFERLFGLCVGKWLLSLITTSRRWTMRLSDSYWYRTKSSSHPNMLSLAFLFESCPVELTDPAGLASVRPTPVQAYDEVSQATDLLKKLIELTDLDVHLRDDPAAFEDAIAKSEALLGSAGYPVNTYRDWVLSVLPALPRRGSA
ncbi:MAG: hypothetical protein RBR19_03195 [Sedimentisphaerales bacterium]|nr:hypothetical protein [Sedimentisphaerales bacterium]